MILILPTAALVYGIAWYTSKQRGVPVDRVFAEIPPE